MLTPGSHGSTFGGTPFVTSVALATLSTVITEKIPEHAVRMGEVLAEGLRALGRELRTVKEVRGRGLLLGVELSHPAGPVVEGCRDRGLLVLSAGDRVLRLAPPLIVQPADCRRALDVIGEVLRRQAA